MIENSQHINSVWKAARESYIILYTNVSKKQTLPSLL